MKSKQPVTPQYRPATPVELRDQRRKEFDKRVEGEKRSRKRLIAGLCRQFGLSPQSREAMRPMSQSEMEQCQLAQAAGMRGMTDDELAVRYGSGLMNAYRPSDKDCKL